ncbi:ATP-binding cassette domain-containing protein [Verticiella sediminum]|uniref:ATP-binding cassette domain-containing protein n=1 Tax=Verticiella sediminum TaxID=1247510 RepID=A0A556ACA0_9BURK|nr:ATP-binding cassette domain-containing protein [Verticiella sediminum]TSH90514.1 ATP-binding cassette domain-containing protein [Verticiella sediminum]
MPVVSATALRFAYRGGPQLIDLPSFALDAGESVFLHGPSGCGKSTLINLLAGTLTPGAGRIEIAGQALTGLARGRRDRLRGDHLGLIFQQFNLLPFLSVRENVLLPCRFSARRAAQASRAVGSPLAAAQALLERLGLDRRLHGRAAGTLSVGQQQRVAAARALIGSPELVLADEPTSALDAAAQQAFIDLLFEQCAATGAALLFVSHDQRLASRFLRVESLPELNRAHPAPLPA